uniref:Uncharacterized protein MANES_08G155200 n=1 Tax=Rhizophora mucronata TaxID=61149 RepID=A0A2P2J150_RHIMU
MSQYVEKVVKPADVDDADCMFAMQLTVSSFFNVTLRTVIELGLLEIIAKAGKGAQLSASEIASHLPTKTPDTPAIIDRMLRLMTSYSILTCSLVNDKEGHPQRLYGLGPVCKYLTRDEDGVSFAPVFQSHSSFAIDSCYHVKDAVLEGGIPLVRAHGKHVFENVDDETRRLFNEAMYNYTVIIMKRVIEIYEGFEDLRELVDVGGGLGANLKIIVSKYPHIKGINFDLPHVIKDAPAIPGVEHVGGDMFLSVPRAEAFFMKSILHDWGDEQCVKILKNCYDALPEIGKVIAVESVLPELPDTNFVSKHTHNIDVAMFLASYGGKERTDKELEALGKKAGFSAMELICRAYSSWVIVFYKRV